MRIGTEVIITCDNRCPAYQREESIKNGFQGKCCEFGTFHSFYGDVHPIPDDCPIKNSDITEDYENQKRWCGICDWTGVLKELKTADNGTENIVCPMCGCALLED